MAQIALVPKAGEAYTALTDLRASPVDSKFVRIGPMSYTGPGAD